MSQKIALLVLGVALFAMGMLVRANGATSMEGFGAGLMLVGFGLAAFGFVTGAAALGRRSRS